MEGHICNNCKYTEKCNQRYEKNFPYWHYCVCNNQQIRDKRNHEFFLEVFNWEDFYKSLDELFDKE